MTGPGQRTGSAILPLHGGKTPRWLFERMARLARAIILMLVEEHGPAEVLTRLSDPFWFQAFGCVLGFDWHSSGLTTTVCGALKQGLRGCEGDTSLNFVGGKGRVARQTPREIELICPPNTQELIRTSKLVAKVDSAAVQDGYDLYHHFLIFSPGGRWAIIQQGMNPQNQMARRYHWLDETTKSFVSDPHRAVCGPCRHKGVVNWVDKESAKAQDAACDITEAPASSILKEYERILRLPRYHNLPPPITPRGLRSTLERAAGRHHPNFEGLLLTPGFGPATLRALGLLSDLIYGASPAVADPVRFSFAHGGKDGVPYPVDKKTYDASIDILEGALRRAHLPLTDKQRAWQALRRQYPRR